MSVLRLLLVLTLITAGFAGAVDARYRDHRRHGDGFDLGDAIIGAAVLGGIIAVANAGKKDRGTRRADPPAPPAPYPDGGYPDDGYPAYPNYPGDGDDWGSAGTWDYADPDYARRFPSERGAVDACAREAETLGRRYGGEARLARIDDVSRGDRDYRVIGVVGIEDLRDRRREDARFTCFANEETVTDFRFEERTAQRD